MQISLENGPLCLLKLLENQKKWAIFKGNLHYELETIQILRKQVFGLFSPHPPTL
jgi:hypothetical protein